jgi:hypothetical protein
VAVKDQEYKEKPLQVLVQQGFFAMYLKAIDGKGRWAPKTINSAPDRVSWHFGLHNLLPKGGMGLHFAGVRRIVDSTEECIQVREGLSRESPGRPVFNREP